jgi:putative acyl-CoA dehydrogenase
MSEFYQAAPELANQYDEDGLLRAWFDVRVPRELCEQWQPGLRALGARVAGDVLALAAQAEAQPPRLVHYDAWGRRIDRVDMAPAWRALHAVAAEEGIVATAYERSAGRWSRVHQFARLYLFHPSSALYTCPLAMTDGAARVLELHGPAELQREVLPRLISRDPAYAWTSGQWMTERTGGSDVSGTTTEARLEDGRIRLYGTKWFTSAVTSEVALALARSPGQSGLSLYCVHTAAADGAPNRMRVLRLKDKLGTRAMPTAELALEGTPAVQVGATDQGVRTVATMLNITRLYNACCAIAGMRRGLALARDYARRRSAFGKALAAHPLHVRTLADLEIERRAAFVLVFELAALLGAEETATANTDERHLLRLLTPVVKLYTAKQGVAVLSEVLECFGGAGYIEDTGLPRLLRDAQVLPIWEGTTNVLSLDVLRVLRKVDALQSWAADIERRVRTVNTPVLAPARAALEQAVARVRDYAAGLAGQADDATEAGARALAFALARCYAGALLIELAGLRREASDGILHAEAAQRWCAGELAPLGTTGSNAALRVLGMEG